MKRYPKIPITPKEVPIQKTQKKIKLPSRPKSFQGICDFLEPMNEKDRPKGSPRKTYYIGSVEWAWSPMHSRIDSYYLNPRGSYWLLWIYWQDDNDWNMRWKWTLYSYAKKNKVEPKDAAIYLLMDAWSAEKENSELDGLFMIDEDGFLSIGELTEIKRIVWPEVLDEEKR